MGLLYLIVVGLIAGWLAGQVMKGGGYGVLVDIILGILGGIVGGWVFGMLGIWPGGGIIGSIVVAFVGAVISVPSTKQSQTDCTSVSACAGNMCSFVWLKSAKRTGRLATVRRNTRNRFTEPAVVASEISTVVLG
jgi:uncharacterized membrane protein YeaQ/YmgE (transglycosylase-associated protein family)